MQLNFLGLVLIGLGIILLGLGISGNYKTFGNSLKQGFLQHGLGEPRSGGTPTDTGGSEPRPRQ